MDAKDIAAFCAIFISGLSLAFTIVSHLRLAAFSYLSDLQGYSVKVIDAFSEVKFACIYDDVVDRRAKFAALQFRFQGLLNEGLILIPVKVPETGPDGSSRDVKHPAILPVSLASLKLANDVVTLDGAIRRLEAEDPSSIHDAYVNINANEYLGMERDFVFEMRKLVKLEKRFSLANALT